MKLAAFDVETSGLEARFEGASVVSDQVRAFETDPKHWLEAMRTVAADGCVMVAHNAEYDVINGLWAHDQDVTAHYFNGVFTLGFWRYQRRGSSAHIWDSYGLTGGRRLELVGEALGLPKLERPQVLSADYQRRRDAAVEAGGFGQAGDDWSRPDRYRWFCERHRIGECIECYNLRDCDIVLAWCQQLVELLESYGLQPGATLAGNAARLWRYFDRDGWQRLRSPGVLALAMAAYHGGRTENFKYGTFSPVYTHDVRSHYLAIMRDAAVPDCSRLFYTPKVGRPPELERVEGLAEAEVIAPDAYVPVLPAVADDRIYYPTGRFRGTWTIAELRAAIARGYRVTDWGAMAWSEATVRPFAGFAGSVLLMRDKWLKAGDPREDTWRTLGNSLAGRLGSGAGGEKQVYRRRVAGLSAKDRAGSELHFAGLTSFLSWRHRVPTAPWGANMLWAAHVTSLGRLRLLDELERAGDDLLYCDTDSVFTSRPMEVGPELPGALRDTGVYAEGVFLAPKVYRLTTWEGQIVVRVKGVPQRVAEDYFIEGKAIYETSAGVVEAISRGIEPGRWYPVDVTRRLNPARRQPLNPSALLDRDQTSDTVPLVFAEDGAPLRSGTA